MRGKRILGIDPGTSRMGLGLVELTTDVPRLIHFDCITTTTNAPETQKLSMIYHQLTHHINEIKPDMMAIEMLFFANNAKTAMAVGQARGVALLAAAQANLEVAEIAPLRLKKLLLGRGNAKKKEVQDYIRGYFGISDKKTLGDDAADAVAIALCHALFDAAQLKTQPPTKS